MEHAKPPQIDCEQLHPTLAVEDLAASIDFYTTKLGFMPAFKWGDPPTMAGLNLGHVQIFLETGEPDPKGCSVYFVVSDADLLYSSKRKTQWRLSLPLKTRSGVYANMLPAISMVITCSSANG